MSLRIASMLALSLLAASARSVRAAGGQETADKEGDQSSLSPEETAAPAEFQTAEDAPEMTAASDDARPYDDDVRRVLGKGHWGVEVVLIDPNGRVRPLSSLHAETEMMPASTMKLFTSWFGYVETEQLDARGEDPVFPAPWISYEAYAAYTLKVSDNAKAKDILKRFAPVHGPSVLEKFYASLGLARKNNFRVVDAAGFSTGNRATAGLEVALLEHIHDSGHYRDYRELLAEPGEMGTLKRRLQDLGGSLYAKTGTLSETRVAALAGFLDAGSAGTIIFSIIGNNPRLTVDVQRERIDAVVEALHRDAVAGRAATQYADLALTRQKGVAESFASRPFAFP